MPYVLHDFYCMCCEHEFEEMWYRSSDDDLDAWKDVVRCPECDSVALKKLLAAPGIAEFSIKDKAGRAASLKKRSEDHSRKMNKKNRDKHRATVQRKMDALKR